MKIFISYSSKDRDHQETLSKQLRALQGFDIEPLSDEAILAGEEIRAKISSLMASADAGILLLSTDFILSEWCKWEMEQLKSMPGRCRLLYAVVRPCNLEPRFSQVHALQKGGMPSSASTPEAFWCAVASEVQDLLRAWRKEKSNGSGDGLPNSSDGWEQIARSLRRGLFTPVVGPGCYEVSEDTAASRSHIRKRLNAVVSGVKGEEDARNFIDGVVRGAYKDAFEEELTDEESPIDEWFNRLCKLQVELARVGALCCQFMGRMMQINPQGFTDIRLLAAPTSPGEELKAEEREAIATHLPALLRQFLETIKAAEDLGSYQVATKDAELRKAAELRHKASGSSEIIGHLIVLAHTIFPDYFRSKESKEFRDAHKKFISAAERLHSQTRDIPRGKLTVIQVEWISDLIWHTLRFDAPMFPTPEELSFQLSVCLGAKAPPRKERMGAFLELESERARADWIRTFFLQYSAASRSAGKKEAELYRVLGRALLECRTVPSHRVVLAISANLDQELERGLNEFERPYWVVFPVFKNSTDGGAPAWMLRKVSWAGYDHPEYQILGSPEVPSLENVSFDGPLVVKLHGSPLEKLPDRNIVHRVVLSDGDSILTMVARERFWPPGLSDILEAKDRVTCLLGYPIADAGSRLRLSDHLSGEYGQRRLFLIDFPEDPLRHELLRHIWIRLIPAQIEEFAGLLERCLKQESAYRGME